MIDTVKTKSRMFLVKLNDSFSQSNIIFLSGRWFTIYPFIKAAARNFKDMANLLHREPRIFKIKGAAEFILYGLDRMPRDFFKMSITSSF